MKNKINWLPSLLAVSLVPALTLHADASWQVDTPEQWESAKAESDGIKFRNGYVETEGDAGFFRSKVIPLKGKKKLARIDFKQSDIWDNWIAVDRVIPQNLGDAPVAVAVGPGNYWLFGRYRGNKKAAAGEDAVLDGFDIPLKTTRYPNQFDAPGGLEKAQGGYHAWQSRDMVNWVHHGNVTEQFARWSTTAEYVDGKLYIYYDFPNDQDPHLYVDDNLFDGLPGQNMGMAFKDPSHGSDCAIIRDLNGKFHLIYENWDPINASKHAWDSPLAGHAVSDDGIRNWAILAPAVDERTKPTGEIAEYSHPHWAKEDPENYPLKPGQTRYVATYEVHEPEQNAYGDWAAICIGGQYYLFGDFDPAHAAKGEKGKSKMSVAWFTSPDINQQFTYCSHVGVGHPDPDIMFAEGRFYLITQTKNDYISPGPWVEKVTARAGVDTDNDGKIDQWTDWQEVKERYDYIKGFAKQVAREPAGIDLSSLPAGHGVAFEFKTQDTTDNPSTPILDSVKITFAE